MKSLENKLKIIIKLINQSNLGDYSLNKTFKDLTTIKIGGKIKLFYLPNNLKSLTIIYKKIIKLKIPYFIIGNGSNLLITDEEFLGIVICLKHLNNYKLKKSNIMMIEAGAQSIKTIKQITKEKIGNLETFGTIPGTIGGLIYNNAGTSIKEIKDVIYSVDYLKPNGKIKNLKNKQLNFNYRSSIFKEKEGIIIRGYFLINHQGDYNLLKELWNKKYITQPIEKNNFGSTFKNLPSIKAWEVIKKLDLKNNHFNDAQISKKHYNFLINEKNATFKDMYNLINYIKKDALEKLNYNLELEIQIIENFKNLKDKSLRIK